MTRNITYEAFDKLNEVLEKNNPEFELKSESYEVFELFRGRRVLQTVQVYRFNNVNIVKEVSTRQRRSILPPQPPVYMDIPLEITHTNFYILKDGNFISDEQEAKKIIKKVTRVSLPKLDTREEEPNLLPLNIDGECVVTKITPDEKDEYLPGFLERTGKKMLEREAYEAKMKLESLPEEFGFTSWEQFISNINLLREKTSEASKDYEEKLKAEKQESMKRREKGIGAIAKH